MVVLAAAPSHIDASGERPIVKVMVGESTDRGATYSYRLINRSAVQATALTVGLDDVTHAAMLPVAPASVAGPPGWSYEIVRTEESAIWEVGWLEPTNGIAAGASLSGFLVRLPQRNSAYETAAFTIYLFGGTTTGTVELEAPVVPVVSCVEEDPATHALTARFQYENRNAYDVPLQIGPANRFVPGDESRGQPTTFLAPPSRPEQVRVPLAAGESLTWELGASTATATSQSPRCAP